MKLRDELLTLVVNYTHILTYFLKDLLHLYNFFYQLFPFSRVKLLINRQTGETVAMKMVDLKKHPDASGSVKKEVCIQKMLNHKNILRYFGTRCQSDIQFIFLEYAAGGELFDRIEPDHGMAEHDARKYFNQLTSGVHYLHTRGVAHRDLKPENLLLDDNNILKISDFGMATMFRY